MPHDHRECSIHIESVCQQHGVKMTQQELEHKVLHQLTKLSICTLYMLKQPNLGYADVKLNLHPCILLAGDAHSLYVCIL